MLKVFFFWKFSVYEKFSQSFVRTSVCGLPKAYKVYLCRTLSRQDYYKSQLDYQGYDEAKCRRKEVLFENKRFTMAMFKCPPLYLVRNDSKQYLQHSLYLSTHAAEKSVLIFHRLNFKGKAIRLDSSVINLDDRILLRHRRRTREFARHRYFLPQTSNTLTAILAPDPQSQQNLLSTPFTVTFDRQIVEDNVIEFTQIMEMKKRKWIVYSWFENFLASNKLWPLGTNMKI